MTRFTVDWQSPHLWQRTAGACALAAPVLQGEAAADLCVIGGGLTGLSTALHAAQAGLSVRLLEAGEVACAASGRNNGLVISHHSAAAPSEIEARYGARIGQRYNALVAQAAPYFFDLLGRLGVDGHQVQQGWIQPAHTAATLARARRFHDEWRAFGAEVAWFARAEITERLGSPYLGGWISPGSGHINPYAATRGLARAAAGLGVRIHEGSEVIAIRRAGPDWRVQTAGGAVRARRVVVAANVVLGRFWPHLRAAMVPMRVFQSATAPLSAAQRALVLRGNPAVSDMRHALRYFHFDREFRIATGGLHTRWGAAEARGMAKTRALLARAFPALAADLPPIEAYWEGVFAVVPDRLPRMMRLAEGVMFGGIYSGRGVALSVSFGRALAGWASGQLGEDDLPVPVSALREVPLQPLATQIANHMHPLARLMDRGAARRGG